jgi:hypothetical protein
MKAACATCLVEFFARSAAATGLAACRQLAEVVSAALGGQRAALAPEDADRWQVGLGENILCQG